MARDGSSTRDNILDTAEALILERGYAGVSVDSIIQRLGITKGAFFHHFKNKQALADALLHRFGEQDLALMDNFRRRAEKLSRDPLQQFLIYIGLFEEMFDNLAEPFPGCLFASYTYELQQFDPATGRYIADSVRRWRRELQGWLETIMAAHPPKLPVDSASLADAFNTVLEGAFIMSKAVSEPALIVQQLRHFKNYIELLFAPG